MVSYLKWQVNFSSSSREHLPQQQALCFTYRYCIWACECFSQKINPFVLRALYVTTKIIISTSQKIQREFIMTFVYNILIKKLYEIKQNLYVPQKKIVFHTLWNGLYYHSKHIQFYAYTCKQSNEKIISKFPQLSMFFINKIKLGKWKVQF